NSDRATRDLDEERPDPLGQVPFSRPMPPVTFEPFERLVEGCTSRLPPLFAPQVAMPFEFIPIIDLNDLQHGILSIEPARSSFQMHIACLDLAGGMTSLAR